MRLAVLFFAAGGLALSMQVVLLRELMVSLQGDETAVALGLAAWLGGIAAGAAGARALARHRPDRWAVIGFALLAALGPLAVITCRIGRWILAPPPGEILPSGSGILLAGVVLAPAGILVGLTFTSLAATAAQKGWRPGQGIAWLYILESLGSLAAGLLVTFVVVPLLPPMSGVCLTACLWVAVGSPAALARLVPGRLVLPACGLLLALLAHPSIAGRIDATTVRARFDGLAPGIPLLDWTDTPYQHVAIGGGDLRHLYAGGQYAGSFPDPTEDEALAHRLASLAPRPEMVLLIGSGALGSVPNILEHPIRRIDLVEIDHHALQVVRRYLPAYARAALEDPRVRIVTDDPRRFLARNATQYDLMVILEPSPVTLRLARLSTMEFYELCATRLAPDGVLVIRFESAPNVLTGEMAALGGSLWRALSSVFPVVRAGPGPESLLLAGTDPAAVTLDPDTLARRFTSRGIDSKVFVPELFPILFPPGRVASQERALREAAVAFAASRDDRPVSFLHALALRQQIAGSLIAPLLAWLARASPYLLGGLALIPSLIFLTLTALRRNSGRVLTGAVTHAVVVIGGCGMIWSLLILFSYQTRSGALYGTLGLLTALFMLGLAAGGLALSQGAELSADRARRWLPAVIGAALLLAILMPIALHTVGSPALQPPGVQDVCHGVLLLVAGAITGSLFPVAAGALLAAQRDVQRTAADLEAADHVGAAIAALVGGVILIPALGLTGTAWFLVALVTVALLGTLLAILKAHAADEA
jgi:spermidine synthase